MIIAIKRHWDSRDISDNRIIRVTMMLGKVWVICFTGKLGILGIPGLALLGFKGY